MFQSFTNEFSIVFLLLCLNFFLSSPLHFITSEILYRFFFFPTFYYLSETRRLIAIKPESRDIQSLFKIIYCFLNQFQRSCCYRSSEYEMYAQIRLYIKQHFNLQTNEFHCTRGLFLYCFLRHLLLVHFSFYYHFYLPFRQKIWSTENTRQGYF